MQARAGVGLFFPGWKFVTRAVQGLLVGHFRLMASKVVTGGGLLGPGNIFVPRDFCDGVPLWLVGSSPPVLAGVLLSSAGVRVWIRCTRAEEAEFFLRRFSRLNGLTLVW